jgi:hypothetical protein
VRASVNHPYALSFSLLVANRLVSQFEICGISDARYGAKSLNFRAASSTFARRFLARVTAMHPSSGPEQCRTQSRRAG